jgi:hypothetical protein
MKARYAALALCLAGQLVLASPVAAKGGGGTTPPPPAAPTNPPAPALLAPAAGASVTQPTTLSWSPSVGTKPIVAYVWQVSSNSTFTALVFQGNAVRPSDTAPAPTTGTFSGLPNGSYFWRVQATQEQVTAIDGPITGPFSAARAITVAGSVAGTLPAPSLTGPPNLFQYHPFEFVRIAWDPVPGADHYLLEYDNEPTFSLPLFNADFSPIPASQTTDPIMFGEPNGNLWFRVRAVAADGTRSLPSNVRQVTVTFTAPDQTIAPLLTAPPDGTTSQLPLTLDWGDDANPQSYELQIGTDPTFAQANAAECTGVEWCVRGIPESQWEIPSLPVGKSYWRVRSEHGDKSPTVPSLSPWSAVRSFTITQTPPAIIAFSVDVMTDNGLTVRSHTNAPSGTTPDNQVFGRLTLNNLVPPGGTPVTLTSSDPSVASVPASVTVPPAGGLDATATLASFPITPKQVATSQTVTITATSPAGSKTVQLTIDPPSLRRLQVAQSAGPVAISGGNSQPGLLLINGAVPPSGATVTFSSTRPDVVPAPADLSVPAGGSTVSFTLATNAVATTTPVTLTASWGASSVSIDLTLHSAPSLLAPASGASFAAGSPVRFDWTEELTSDEIQVSTSASFASTVLDSVLFATSELTTSSLPAGTLYWRARAYDSGFSPGAWSETRTVTITGSTGPLAAPALSAPASGGRVTAGQSVTFSWSAVAGAASYAVQVDDSTAFTAPLTVSQSVTGTQFSTSTLPKATLSWRVRAVDAAGNPGTWSSVRSLQVR